ncbi:MAG: nicotinamide mononucleotide transporter, partial [Mizugakiibacter sp.]|uniref:nicotinamide mononucleotide transporter n=1 Tax=Mizugakiibacter sp. TaxID=1972610 RepID=UPI00320C5C6E
MSRIELAAALLSAWAVWLMARRRPLGWPIGLLSVLVYAAVFLDAKLYSDALLQGAFAALIVYGWHRWLR